MAQSVRQHLLLYSQYNKWAHAQIGTFCMRYFKDKPDFYTKNINLPFQSIRNTLAHLWMAEQIWYARMINATHRNLFIPHKAPRTINMNEIVTYWADKPENEGKFELFFDGVDNELLFNALSKSADNWIELVMLMESDEELCQECRYFDTKGKQYIENKNLIVQHVINHSTHHRGQISAAVTILCENVKPIQLDYAVWLRLQQKQNMTNSSTLQ